MLINLTHEVIHAKQFISGELSPTTARWKNSDYTKTPYSKQPWEREAYVNMLAAHLQKERDRIAEEQRRS